MREQTRLVTISTGDVIIFQWELNADQLLALNDYANELVERS